MTTRVINALAPIRICDNGGWTDTWFARHGKVFSIAVSPCVEVQVKARPHAGGGERITIAAENYGERYTIAQPEGRYGRQPLIEAALDCCRVPGDVDIEISIYSEAPPGCSTGTSASLSVALLGALDRLRGGCWTPYQTAMEALRVERELLNQQSGIQDQLAAAHGGINFIEMSEYPESVVVPLSIPEARAWELETRLALIYVGSSHRSDDVHKMVIRELESTGAGSPKLEALRLAAEHARDALCAGDFDALGRAFVENSDAQAALHPNLIGARHRRVIEIARDFQAAGWKVNGAAGEGGSVAILGHPEAARRRRMVETILRDNPGFANIPVRLSRHGLRVWESAWSDL